MVKSRSLSKRSRRVRRSGKSRRTKVRRSAKSRRSKVRRSAKSRRTKVRRSVKSRRSKVRRSAKSRRSKARRSAKSKRSKARRSAKSKRSKARRSVKSRRSKARSVKSRRYKVRSARSRRRRSKKVSKTGVLTNKAKQSIETKIDDLRSSVIKGSGWKNKLSVLIYAVLLVQIIHFNHPYLVKDIIKTVISKLDVNVNDLVDYGKLVKIVTKVANEVMNIYHASFNYVI